MLPCSEFSQVNDKRHLTGEIRVLTEVTLSGNILRSHRSLCMIWYCFPLQSEHRIDSISLPKRLRIYLQRKTYRNSQLDHCAIVWTWANEFLPLSLNFLLWKIEAIVVITLNNCWNITGDVAPLILVRTQILNACMVVFLSVQCLVWSPSH